MVIDDFRRSRLRSCWVMAASGASASNTRCSPAPTGWRRLSPLVRISSATTRPWRAGDYRPEPPVPGARAIGRANHGRQGLKVACLEDIAYRHGWIDASALEKLALPLAKNGYGQYLLGLLGERVF
jgi:hypothetical protein